MFRETLLAANAIYTDLYANPDGSLPVNSNNKNKKIIFFLNWVLQIIKNSQNLPNLSLEAIAGGII